MKLSIIYPICSFPDPFDPSGYPHPFLLESLDSILNGGSDSIEILIGIDGKRPMVVTYINHWIRSRNVDSQKVKIFEFDFSGTFGNRQRNILIHHATGTYLSFMDQDDAYAPGAIAIILNRLSGSSAPAFFRMEISWFGNHTDPFDTPLYLWKESGLLAKGHVGGHMFVVPNLKHLLSEWPEQAYEADYHFIKNTCDTFSSVGVFPQWYPDVVARIRPWAIDA